MCRDERVTAKAFIFFCILIVGIILYVFITNPKTTRKITIGNDTYIIESDIYDDVVVKNANGGEVPVEVLRFINKH